MKKNVIVGQSGALTAVINASFIRSCHGSVEQKKILFGAVFGMINGIEAVCRSLLWIWKN